MRKAVPILIALVVGVGLVGASAASVTARVRIVDQQPIVVRGDGFHAGERVRVTVTSASRETNVVRAGLRGTFTSTFDGVLRDRCSGLVVRAVGSRGTLAVAKLPQPMCMPQ